VIPALAGQIYAMPGMQTQLNLKADKPGRFGGLNTQFNGSGFHEQHFNAVAMASADFDAWLARVRTTGVALNAASYAVLSRPSSAAIAVSALGTPAMPPEVLYFNSVAPDHFAAVMHKYMSGSPVTLGQQPGALLYPSLGSKR
jgi:cytochrome o ubiquinol oxidase subunit 2